MRALFVANPFSVHTVRWLSQLTDAAAEIHVFDPDNKLLHDDLRGVVVHTGWKKPRVPPETRVRCSWPFLRGRHVLARRLPWLWRRIVRPPEERLAHLLARARFDFVHSFGLWRYSETVLRAREILGGSLPAPWIYSCMGSDIYHYRQLPERRPTIRSVLAACDFYICDCDRDLRLAREEGFRGEAVGVLPGGGGFPIDAMQERRSDPVSRRKVVAVKGLETDFGNALVAVEALAASADKLKDCRIVFYQSHPETIAAARRLAAHHGLDVTVLPRSAWWSIVELFGQSRVALGVSLSDGTPNAMLEAMIMGAFPIQTNPGGATAEWIDDGSNGLIVPPDDPRAIARALDRALADDSLVERAAVENLRRMRERVDERTIRPRVRDLYRKISGTAPGR